MARGRFMTADNFTAKSTAPVFDWGNLYRSFGARQDKYDTALSDAGPKIAGDFIRESAFDQGVLEQTQADVSKRMLEAREDLKADKDVNQFNTRVQAIKAEYIDNPTADFALATRQKQLQDAYKTQLAGGVTGGALDYVGEYLYDEANKGYIAAQTTTEAGDPNFDYGKLTYSGRAAPEAVQEDLVLRNVMDTLRANTGKTQYGVTNLAGAEHTTSSQYSGVSAKRLRETTTAYLQSDSDIQNRYKVEAEALVHSLATQGGGDKVEEYRQLIGSMDKKAISNLMKEEGVDYTTLNDTDKIYWAKMENLKHLAETRASGGYKEALGGVSERQKAGWRREKEVYAAEKNMIAGSAYNNMTPKEMKTMDNLEDIKSKYAGGDTGYFSNLWNTVTSGGTLGTKVRADADGELSKDGINYDKMHTLGKLKFMAENESNTTDKETFTQIYDYAKNSYPDEILKTMTPEEVVTSFEQNLSKPPTQDYYDVEGTGGKAAVENSLLGSNTVYRDEEGNIDRTKSGAAGFSAGMRVKLNDGTVMSLENFENEYGILNKDNFSATKGYGTKFEKRDDGTYETSLITEIVGNDGSVVQVQPQFKAVKEASYQYSQAFGAMQNREHQKPTKTDIAPMYVNGRPIPGSQDATLSVIKPEVTDKNTDLNPILRIDYPDGTVVIESNNREAYRNYIMETSNMSSEEKSKYIFVQGDGSNTMLKQANAATMTFRGAPLEDKKKYKTNADNTVTFTEN